MANRSYLCIDLKSFYASVECVERGLDPMSTNLVVADPERSDRTICLAVTPAMKALGVKNRCRVFQIPQSIKYIMAEPRMQKYIDYAAEIYGIYLQYLSKDDIHVYSIDEAFLDVTLYLPLYGLTCTEMAMKLLGEIYERLGLRATCGIGTNLYLTKVALDITAKHAIDFIGILDEDTYKATLWDHTPITDFWMVGSGTAKRLQRIGITTMRQIAGFDEDILYKIFGIDAELLIDHAWGRESTTISDIKAFKPRTNSLSSGQVLMRDYSFDEAKLIVREMMDLLCLDLVGKKMLTSSVTLHVSYSAAIQVKSAHGTASLSSLSNSDSILIPAVMNLYDKIVDKDLPIRRINISCNKITPETAYRQLSLFDMQDDTTDKNREVQKVILEIKKRYGKNAMLKGMNFEKCATTRDRNSQIGGHKSGNKE